jgi:hypothetical protein
VVEAQILDLIFGRVDLLVGILELGLDDEGGRIAVSARGGVVGACVATFSLHIWDVAVLPNQYVRNQVLGREERQKKMKEKLDTPRR